ncbi:hypothetical protein LINPERPRIM_LOCUS5287 [Linum perenne]
MDTSTGGDGSSNKNSSSTTSTKGVGVKQKTDIAWNYFEELVEENGSKMYGGVHLVIVHLIFKRLQSDYLVKHQHHLDVSVIGVCLSIFILTGGTSWKKTSCVILFLLITI